jgi:hypothetical protein
LWTLAIWPLVKGPLRQFQMPPSLRFCATTASRGLHVTTSITLATGEFIRRFLIHVLPQGFHRISPLCLFAGATKAEDRHRAQALGHS